MRDIGPFWMPRRFCPCNVSGGDGGGERGVKKIWKDESIPVLTGFSIQSQAELDKTPKEMFLWLIQRIMPVSPLFPTRKPHRTILCAGSAVSVTAGFQVQQEKETLGRR